MEMTPAAFVNFFQNQFHAFAQQKLPTMAANPILQGIIGDPDLRAFGDREFADAEEILRLLAPEDRARTLVCLFIVVASDQNIFAHFKSAYPAWLSRTRMPKFGWVGLSLHNENPLKLIQVPGDRGLVNLSELSAEVELGMVCFVHIVRDTLKDFAPTVKPEAFFQALLTDPDMRYMRGHPLLDALRDELRRASNVVG
jgi:hypothetical protein